MSTSGTVRYFILLRVIIVSIIKLYCAMHACMVEVSDHWLRSNFDIIFFPETLQEKVSHSSLVEF